MADFDAFEDTPATETTNDFDPAADFLAREQEELQGLEDDNFDAAKKEGDQDDAAFDGFTQINDSSPQPSGDFSGDFGGGEQQQPETNDSYSAISQVDKLRAEPEKIRVWREEHTRRIEKKDKEEAKRKDEWREIAKKELDDWYKHHEEQLTKTKAANRESEEAFVADRDQTQPGEEWEKICRLCEFNPKNSKNMKDITRMRQILLQLKQTPLVR